MAAGTGARRDAAEPPRRWDPRLYQIATLGGLLVYGLGWLDFDLPASHAVAILATVLLVQLAATRLSSRSGFDPKSALISGLSLCLLLRTNSLALAVLAAAIAIASKFVLRCGGKHVFNPTNLALVTMILLTGQVWVSPGQWGSTAVFGFLLASAGGLVVNRAARSDVTLTFIAAYAALLIGRSLWLGEPASIPLHRLESGALVLFAFFMISDPKTTPDSRAGRMLFAALVAAGAWIVQFKLFRTNGLLWSLALCSLAVALIDQLLPGPRYVWGQRAPLPTTTNGEPHMKRTTAAAILVLLTLLSARTALAFCGFYVAKADTKLFNQASQVVLVRQDDRTVLTMANDFRGDLKEFAIVVPVPTVLEREQIHVGDRAVLQHLDAYSAPRLVEYFDPNPCEARVAHELARGAAAPAPMLARREKSADSLGVTIEAQYTVGEYDILILSARDSSGLETWLRDNGYRIPAGASAVLGSYLKQNMRFFVARVNLGEQARLGYTYLRPLQVAYESPKFMLPIRLGMVNADGPQELYVYALTRKGRVETTNYRTVRLPSGMDLPLLVKAEFGSFYKAMFSESVRRENMQAIFLEYAWDMGWCDPCAADPLSPDELRRLGVFWLEDRGAAPGRSGAARDAFLTRLHVRYDAGHFPEDLVFQETADRTNFQGRYVLRHPWAGSDSCEAAARYRVEVARRQEAEVQALARLTGWPMADIRARAPVPGDGSAPAKTWWQKLWGK